MMSNRERMLAPFLGRQPDRPAWVADLSYWYEAHRAAGTLDPCYAGEDGLLRLHAQLGVCCYYNHLVELFEPHYDGVAVETQEHDGVRRRSWRTPVGELVETMTYLATSSSWAHTMYPVRTAADLAVLRDIAERTSYEACPATRFDDIQSHLGEAGIPLVAAPRSPLPALLTDWCGVEAAIYMLMDEPEAASRAMTAIAAANDTAFDVLTASSAFLVHFADNLDSRSSTPYFNAAMRDYYEMRLGQLHNVGKVAVVHLDGGVRGLIGKLAACGFDGIEAVTPKPVGDVPLEALRELVGNNHTVIWGGIPGAMFCAPWTAEDIRLQTQQVLDRLRGDGRLIVGIADQIPPNGDIDFCRQVGQVIEEAFP